jgi:hypothetical protein
MIGILVAIGAGVLTYGFLYVCNWLNSIER